MNRKISKPLTIIAFSIIVFLAVNKALFNPKDDTSLEKSHINNLHQIQAEGTSGKDEYPYVQNIDGLVVFNTYDYQAYGHSDYAEIMAEGVYGLRLATNGTTVTVTPYRHNANITDVTKITYVKIENGAGDFRKNVSLSLVSFNESTSFDFKGQADGVYRVNVSFKNSGKISTIHGFVIKNGNTVHTCQTATRDAVNISKSLEVFHKYTDGLNPKDYVSLKGLTYPSAGGDLGYVDDVASIAKFSKDKFSVEEWNDEVTVYAMVEWLNENIAYDTWRTDVNNDESRAHKLNNYTDPSIFCWHNKVGVCWDYTNILTIMCRAQGIPATSIDTATHTWNIIYLNGRWVSVDVCDTGKYESKTYNGDREQWTANKSRTWDYYMTYGKPMQMVRAESTSDQIWTRKRALVY